MAAAPMAMMAGPRLNTPTMAVPSVALLVQQAACARQIQGSTSDSADQKSV
jgi:hypothetical protein